MQKDKCSLERVMKQSKLICLNICLSYYWAQCINKAFMKPETRLPANINCKQLRLLYNHASFGLLYSIQDTN